MDDADNCPNEPKGVDGYDDGCPYVPLSGDGEEGLFGVDAGIIMLALGGLGGLAIVSLLVVRLLRRRTTTRTTSTMISTTTRMRRKVSLTDSTGRPPFSLNAARSVPERRSNPGPSSGPSGPAPSRTAPVRKRGPPGGPAKTGGPPAVRSEQETHAQSGT